MKRILLLAILVFALVQVSFAQGYILCGQIVDANNKPIKNAGIQAVSNDKLVSGNTNDDGLYFTPEMPDGKYEVIIVADKITYISRVDIAPTDPRKRFYNFKIKDKKVILSTTDNDSFMETAFIKLRNGSGGKINRERPDITKPRRH